MEKVLVVLPTKNRPADLQRALSSLAGQSGLDSVLIKTVVIDQSDSVSDYVEIFDGVPNIHFSYIYNPSINGLVEAKRYALSFSDTSEFDFVLFLEDDIVLEDTAIHELLCTMRHEKECIGVCAYIPQTPKRNKFFELFSLLFNFGVFRDDRVRMLNASIALGRALPVNRLPGGVTLFRSKVFGTVEFRVESPFHYLEDIDFSLLVKRAFPTSSFLVVPTSIINHYTSSLGRVGMLRSSIRRIKEVIELYKLHKNRYWYASPSVAFACLWVVSKFVICTLSRRG